MYLSNYGTRMDFLILRVFEAVYKIPKGASINHVTPKSRLTLTPRDAFVTFPLFFFYLQTKLRLGPYKFVGFHKESAFLTLFE